MTDAQTFGQIVIILRRRWEAHTVMCDCCRRSETAPRKNREATEIRPRCPLGAALHKTLNTADHEYEALTHLPARGGPAQTNQTRTL